MIQTIFLIATLGFLATLPCLLLAAISNPEAFNKRGDWTAPKISLWRSNPDQRQNSDRFMVWGIVKISQVSFLVMIASFILARI